MVISSDTTAAFTSPSPSVANTAAGSVITAATFRQMVDILDTLVQHNHTFTDDYTSNCQCNCGRGSL